MASIQLLDDKSTLVNNEAEEQLDIKISNSKPLDKTPLIYQLKSAEDANLLDTKKLNESVKNGYVLSLKTLQHISEACSLKTRNVIGTKLKLFLCFK